MTKFLCPGNPYKSLPFVRGCQKDQGIRNNNKWWLGVERMYIYFLGYAGMRFRAFNTFYLCKQHSCSRNCKTKINKIRFMSWAPKPKRGWKGSSAAEHPCLFIDAQIVRRTASAGRPQKANPGTFITHTKVSIFAFSGRKICICAADLCFVIAVW